jgi:hypothetical protein
MIIPTDGRASQAATEAEAVEKAAAQFKPYAPKLMAVWCAGRVG